jgi:hypothetical protein
MCELKKTRLLPAKAVYLQRYNEGFLDLVDLPKYVEARIVDDGLLMEVRTRTGL